MIPQGQGKLNRAYPGDAVAVADDAADEPAETNFLVLVLLPQVGFGQMLPAADLLPLLHVVLLLLMLQLLMSSNHGRM